MKRIAAEFDLDDVHNCRYSDSSNYTHHDFDDVDVWGNKIEMADIRIIEMEDYFEVACRDGKLDDAKKIHESYPSMDITSYEQAFRWACEHRNLDVAEWLLDVKPSIDISSEDDYAFCWACRRRNVDIAIWLQSMERERYILKIVNHQIVEFRVLKK